MPRRKGQTDSRPITGERLREIAAHYEGWEGWRGFVAWCLRRADEIDAMRASIDYYGYGPGFWAEEDEEPDPQPGEHECRYGHGEMRLEGEWEVCPECNWKYRHLKIPKKEVY